MFLLTWHGTLIRQPDLNGALRHEAMAGGDLTQALDIDVPDGAERTSLRHAALGMLRIEPAAERKVVCLTRDGLYLCADGTSGLAAFDRPSPANWESFLVLDHQQAAGLVFILGHRWIVRESRQVIPLHQIALHAGFRLRLGATEIDLAASIGTLVKQWREAVPVVLAVTQGGTDTELVVAEPRSSALVETELWPVRARRVAEILTFALHRHLAGREPSQTDLERDVAFLRERGGPAGLEDLLEQMADRPAMAADAAATLPGEPVFDAGLAAMKTHIAAGQTGLAKAALENLIQAIPDMAQLWLRLGDMHHEAASYGLAQQAWEKCLALEPEQEAAALRLANGAAYFGRQIESIERLKALVAAIPHAQDPHVFLAQRYAELDWMDLVLDSFAPVASALTDWKEERRRGLAGRFETLGKQFRALASRKEPLSPQDAVKLARLAFSLGRLDDCTQLMAAFPANVAGRADSQILRADLRLRQAGLADAIAYLEAVQGPARANQGLIVALARLHAAASRTDEAMAALYALVRHTPRGDAFRLLCMLALAADDREVFRYATTHWCALHPQDTMASQWAIAEAWSDGRILRVDDVAGGPSDPPTPLMVQFWDSAERPIEVIQAMQTWQNRHPGVVHLVFDDAGARAFIAAFCDADVLECYAAAHHPAMQSDIFRLAFLSVRGGIYADADDMCTRDARGIFAALSTVELVAVRSGEAPPYVHNNFIAARPGCAIIADALQDAVRSVREQAVSGGRVDIWQTTGPGLLTRAIARFTADPANAGRVMLLNEVEHRSFSVTQEMAYKRGEKGDWRLLDPAAPPVRSTPQAVLQPAPSAIDDMLMGWAMRQAAPWQFKPVSRADAEKLFDGMNRTRGWISIFEFAKGEITVRPKPAHVPMSDLLHERIGRYLHFFRSVQPLLPPDFSTTLCMGMGDALWGSAEVPMFCFQKEAGHNTLLLPDVDFLNHDFYVKPEHQDRRNYHEKQLGAVFAGSTTGGAVTPEIARALSLPRLRAAQFFTGSAKVDFRLPSILQCSSPEAEALLRAQAFCQKPILEWQDQLARRMLISIDGNGAACSRVALALHSNSVLLKYDSVHLLYYFGGLQPWVHYVPIAQDSDIERVIDMEARDPERFARIAENGRVFSQTYLNAEAAGRYTAMLLRLYEESFSDVATPLPKVAPRPVLAPVPQGDTGVALAHIQNRGDRTAPLGSWLGERGSRLAIEGIVISLPASYPPGFTYQVVMGNGVASEAAKPGTYCGTRGENQPVFGLAIAVGANFAHAFDVVYEANFTDGTSSGRVPPGTICSAPSAVPLEAVRIDITPKT